MARLDLRWAVWASCLGLTGVTGLSAPDPVNAHVVRQEVPLKLTAGIFCNYPSDGSEPAPSTRTGQIGLFDHPYRLVHLGDKVPALPDLSIGIVVKLQRFEAGEMLTVQVRRLEDTAAPDTWQTHLNGDGRFWFGTSPDTGTSLAYGHDQMSVFRKFQPILIHEFNVLPPSMLLDLANLCRPVVS